MIELSVLKSPEEPNENAIRRQILTYLHYEKIFAWSQHNVGIFDAKNKCYRRQSWGQRKGVSDILGIYCGKPLAIEVKTRTGRVSPHQLEFLEDFKKAGGIAFVARSIEDVKENLKRYV